MQIDEKHIATGNAIVIWDGITRPETKDGKVIHSLKIAMAPGSPEIAELQGIVQKALNDDSKFKGVLPPGGLKPFILAGTDKPSPDAQVDGYTMVNAKTRNGAPTVHNADGKVLTPMEYGGMLYPGAVVRIAVHAFAYDNSGNAGIALSLDGIQIVDATAPKLAIGGGIDTNAVFGAQAAVPAGQAPIPVTGTVPGQTPVPTPTPVAAAPAADFLHPPIMTPKAGGNTYKMMQDAGWTDEQLINQGYMTR